MTKRFTIPGEPVGKPRMTQRDKWSQRPCVLRYRAWADAARLAAGHPRRKVEPPVVLRIVVYIAIPLSWTELRRSRAIGQIHRKKPDLSNINKAVEDALFLKDEQIAMGAQEKRWDDGRGPRVEVEAVW